MVKILDTTLRDGNYVIDFQFTGKDTALIASAIDKTGIDYIEVGHGLGMNASSNPKMKAASSDEEYLEATSAAVQNAKWGMFFIPGIGRLEDIDLAAKYGMDFIRIGTDVTEVEKSEAFIQRAKKFGMYVSSNFMKTYALSPDEVGMKAELAANYGSDIACIVDSAGGMFPEDVETYFNSIRDRTDIPVGFHGHNNLGLAISNTIKAVEMGAEIVDTSIRGMGRSAGNAITEILLLALKRKSFDHQGDVTKILDIAENFIDPLMEGKRQVDSINVISGYAQFHSSFLGSIFKYAEKYHIDPRELIVRVSEKDRVNAPGELIENLAKELLSEKDSSVSQIKVSYKKTLDKIEDAKDIDIQRLGSLLDHINIDAKKFGKKTAFNIVQNIRNKISSLSDVINVGNNFFYGSLEVYDYKDIEKMISVIDGQVDYILLDADNKIDNSANLIKKIKNQVQSSKMLYYSDIDAWVRSIVNLVIELFEEKFPTLNVGIVGSNLLANSCQKQLELRGVNCTFLSQDNILAGEFDTLVICQKIKETSLEIDEISTIIDAYVGSLSESVLNASFENNVMIYRPSMNDVIHSELQALSNVKESIANKTGITMIDGKKVVAGGIIAPRGTIVLDSISQPQKVIGLASGTGHIIPEDEYTEDDKKSLEEMESFITNKHFQRYN